MRYKIILSDMICFQIAHFSPSLKSKVREACDKLARNPHAGKPLKDEFKGYWRYRVLRYRIIYKIDHGRIEVLVLGIGNRSGIYDWFLKWVAENEGK